ncbi:MAG: DUF86 domain-containing protein [Spirochaetes bacterium]|nr:DUF86 domain-containing protein [Spirochaetota bacterium]
MKNDKDLIFIKHIADAICNIETFVLNKTFDEFNNDLLISSAAIRMFEIIGEASNNISMETKNRFSDIPWRIMKDMRNFLIHQYFGVDSKTIWDTIKTTCLNLRMHLIF